MPANENRVIGERVLRLEDGPLLRGSGRFVDDLKAPGMLEAAFVRSPHAHAVIRSFDAEGARRLPGVHAVFAYDDLAPLLTQDRLPLQFRSNQLPPDVTPFVLAKRGVAGHCGGCSGFGRGRLRAFACDLRLSCRFAAGRAARSPR